MAAVAKREYRRRSVGTRWASRLVWIVLAVGVVVSCGGHRYPDNWPKMIEKGDCSEISGVYVNQAKAAPTNSGAWRSSSTLAWFIWNWSAGLTPDVSVEFKPPSTLLMSFLADGTTKEYRYQCSCKNGKITIHENIGLTDTYSFYLASDRSLVIEVEGRSGTCEFLKTPQWDTYYYLFPRAMNAPAKQSVVQ